MFQPTSPLPYTTRVPDLKGIFHYRVRPACTNAINRSTTKYIATIDILLAVFHVKLYHIRKMSRRLGRG